MDRDIPLRNMFFVASNDVTKIRNHQPQRFVFLAIIGVLLYGPPGTGKTLSARAVANRTDACFIRVIGCVVQYNLHHAYLTLFSTNLWFSL